MAGAMSNVAPLDIETWQRDRVDFVFPDSMAVASEYLYIKICVWFL